MNSYYLGRLGGPNWIPPQFRRGMKLTIILMVAFLQVSAEMNEPKTKVLESPLNKASLTLGKLQQQTVKGTVKDASGIPLEGVSVQVKNQLKIGTLTSSRGEYSLDVPDGATLIFSFIGYTPFETAVGGKSVINVVLESSVSELDRVVVLGFGQKQKKIAQTGSIASIGTKELTQSPVSNITNALAGRLPGLIAIQRSGEPGADASELYIRGIATLNSSSPLVTIDGIEKDYDEITRLDANEIENVSILKDASATALYGVKGANGVIIITTRRGKEGKAVIGVTSQYAIQKPTNLPHYLQSYDHATLRTEAYLNDNPGGTLLPYTAEQLEGWKTHSDPYLYPDVDWFKEILKPSSYFRQTNFNISGGSKQVRFFVNMGYTGQDGIYKQEKNDLYDPTLKFERYNFRSNVDIDFNKDFSIALNLFGGIENKNQQPTTNDAIFSDISRNSPMSFPIRYPNGFYGSNGSRNNPAIRLNRQGFAQSYNSTLSGMVSAVHKLGFILPGLSAKVNFSFDGYFTNLFTRGETINGYMYNGTGSYDDEANYTKYYSASPLRAPVSSFSQNRDTWIDGSLSYQQDFGKSHVTGLLLANRQQKVRGGAIPFVSQGLVSRVTYSYDDTYFAEFNAGYNGTDNFAKSNRYGFFPAVSAGWVALRGGKVINFLKFRGSYGLNGNDQLSGGRRWLFLSEFKTGTGYSFGEQLKSISGFIEGDMSNPIVTWEKAQRSNIGIELNLFGKGLLDIVGDYFYETRRDMLVIPRDIAYEVGVASASLPPANFGRTKNQGFEIEASHRNTIGSVRYFVKGNMSYTRNKILAMSEESKLWPNLARTGHPIGQNFGMVSMGFFQSQEEIDKSPLQTFGPVIPGDIKFKDVNGDGQIDGNDVAAIGSSRIPGIMYGISGGINWKGFDFSFLFQGASDFSVIKQLEAAYEFYSGGRVLEEHLGRWTPATAATATYPALHFGRSGNNHRTSSFYLQDASYVRLKNLEIGYTFRDVRVTTTKRFSSLRIYLTGMNLLTWDTMNSGFDPESPDGRYSTYPQMKVYNMGLSIKF